MTVHPLRRLRSAQGLSQEALSERSGVSREHISRIELGKATRVRKSTLVALAWPLDIPLPAFLQEVHDYALNTKEEEIR